MSTHSHSKPETPASRMVDSPDHCEFMDQALIHAQTALARGDFPVGCVIVYQDEIIATGSRTGTNSKDECIKNEIDHAEIVALRQFYRYETPIDHSKTRLYCTMEPCLMCYGAVLLSGIGTIVYAYEDAMGGSTQLDLSRMAPLYQKKHPTIIPNIRRNKSLKLFKTFFNNNPSGYWKGSYLANYTLSQT